MVMVVAVVVDTPEHRLIALLCFPFLLPHPPLSLPPHPHRHPLSHLNRHRHIKSRHRYQLLGPSGQLGSPYRCHKRYQEGSRDDLGCYESYYGGVFVSSELVARIDFGCGRRRAEGRKGGAVDGRKGGTVEGEG